MKLSDWLEEPISYKEADILSWGNGVCEARNGGLGEEYLSLGLKELQRKAYHQRPDETTLSQYVLSKYLLTDMLVSN